MSTNYILDVPKGYKKEKEDDVVVKWVEDKKYNEDDKFISVNMETPLEVRLKYYNIPNDNLVIIKKESETSFDDDYQIFSGKKMKTKNKKVKREILSNLRLFSTVMFEMLKAGYLEEENNKKISDWIPSFQEPILKLFVKYHGVETSNGSMSIEDEYMINPAFRKMILIMMMKIISNFIVNNDMIKIEKIDNFLDKKTWMGMREQVGIFRDTY